MKTLAGRTQATGRSGDKNIKFTTHNCIYKGKKLNINIKSRLLEGFLNELVVGFVRFGMTFLMAMVIRAKTSSNTKANMLHHKTPTLWSPQEEAESTLKEEQRITTGIHEIYGQLDKELDLCVQ